jgi:hypothetical protein
VNLLGVFQVFLGSHMLFLEQVRPEFLFWFIFLLNVGLFLVIIILLRFAYPTYATCPIHNKQLRYISMVDQYYCDECGGYIASPKQIKR